MGDFGKGLSAFKKGVGGAQEEAATPAGQPATLPSRSRHRPPRPRRTVQVRQDSTARSDAVGRRPRSGNGVGYRSERCSVSIVPNCWSLPGGAGRHWSQGAAGHAAELGQMDGPGARHGIGVPRPCRRYGPSVRARRGEEATQIGTRPRPPGTRSDQRKSAASSRGRHGFRRPEAIGEGGRPGDNPPPSPIEPPRSQRSHRPAEAPRLGPPPSRRQPFGSGPGHRRQAGQGRRGRVSPSVFMFLSPVRGEARWGRRRAHPSPGASPRAEERSLS